MNKAISALVVLAAWVWAGMAAAQSVFVQVEAHPNIPAAQARADGYRAANIDNVNGFRLGSGWYAISLGPYDEATAIRTLNVLKSRGAIPPDAFLVNRSAYSEQFYGDANAALVTQAPEAPEQPATTATAAATAATAAEQPAAAATTENPLETALVQPSAPAVPVIPPEPPEETRREALRSELQLDRQSKFDLQIALKWFGFYTGPIDAAFGPGTRNSMSQWQAEKGHEPTGVLTTRQRAELLGEYQAVLASLGLGTITDNRAGITIELPLAMVKFDRHDPPFAHYTAQNGSGVTVLLISQKGDESTLLGLYDIMQTLEIVPLKGERTRKANRFTLTGENDRITSHTYAVLEGGEIKGFTLIWPTEEDRRREVVLKAMRDSFSPIRGTVLPDTVGDGALEQSVDLISGLKIRRPSQSRSGFYISSRGMVLTTAAAVQGCGRVTLDEVYDAQVVAVDDATGLALLQPAETLAPLDFARFQAVVPRLQTEVAVSGYSFEGMLGAPSLTFGTLADLRGLQGEETVKRLALAASPGDAGGPVLDASGSVLGILLPPGQQGSRRLPDDVSFAADAVAIADFLSGTGLAPAASNRIDVMSAEDLSRHGAKLTVLVGCWDE